MIYVAGSIVLGISGATGMWIALLGHVRAAAWWLLATSPPASAYDVVTRQYGYLILCAMSVSMAVATIRRNSETSNNRRSGEVCSCYKAVAGSPTGPHKPGAPCFDAGIVTEGG